MNPDQKYLITMINSTASKLKQLEYAHGVVPTDKFQQRINILEEKLFNYRAELNDFPVQPAPIARTKLEKLQRKLRHAVPYFYYLTPEGYRIDFTYPTEMTILEMEKVEAKFESIIRSAKRVLKRKQDELYSIHRFGEMPHIDESNYYVSDYIRRMRVVTFGVKRTVKFSFPRSMVINDLLNAFESLKEHHKSAVANRMKTDSEIKDSLENEIREMALTIAQHLGQELKETQQGFFVYSGDKKLKISKSGFVRHWFSAESFSGFDDYEFWIEKVRLEGKGTPLANHAAYHVSKRKLA